MKIVSTVPRIVVTEVIVVGVQLEVVVDVTPSDDVVLFESADNGVTTCAKLAPFGRKNGSNRDGSKGDMSGQQKMVIDVCILS